MQKIIKLVLFATISFFFISLSHAGAPVWTFTADAYYVPTVSITSVGTATIKYVVTNQSSKTHTLVMQPIAGITQITTAGNCPNPFTLAYRQSCTLNLSVNGAALTNDVKSGPVVCQQGSTLQCYQPNAASVLNITRIPIAQYVITPSANANGTIAPSTPQTVLAGSNLTFTATPNANYNVDQWIVDNGIAQKGGSTFTLTNIIANHTVEVTFAIKGSIYSGTLSGLLYFSTDNGLTWSTTSTPSSGFAVNSVFATTSALYVGSADGKVYYSTNNGTLWNSTTMPDGSAVNGVYVKTINSVLTIYAVTQNGNVFYTTDGSAWTATTAPGSGAINSIFITSANVIYVGSADGNVYFSSNAGSSWTKINGPTTLSGMSIQNVFATNSQLYINARHVSTNGTLPPGTIDFEYAYTSNSLTNPNPTWSILSQITYTLFVNSDASLIHAGTQDGYVFSLTTGDELGFVTKSPITSLFFLG